MSIVDANGVQIEIEVHGSVKNPALILVRGLGTQLIDWPNTFIDTLVNANYRVICFDNRDVGLSQKFIGRVNLDAVARGDERSPYTLSDMAGDVIGVMDALCVKRAHVFGMSMGGMIAQVLATEHPRRLLSICSVMSSSGKHNVLTATPIAKTWLTATSDQQSDTDAADKLVASELEICGSPMYPETLEIRLAIARRRRERNYYPPGLSRQLAAVIASGNRTNLLKTIKIPCLVLHGEDDSLIPVSAGIDTAECIDGSELVVVPGMGHNIPEALAPTIAAHTIDFLDRQVL